jgi:ribonuclease HII
MNKRFEFDRKFCKNFSYIVGTDEAGRGCGAGPVFASAVCFTSIDKNLLKNLEKLNDSKQLSEKVREELFEIIIKNSIYSIQQGSVEEIEKYNILRTSLLTMRKACNEVIEKLNDDVLVLVDGNKKILDFKYAQKTIVKGDFQSASIAAASILSKVSRDRFMIELDKEFPQYKWAENKAYMTKSHLEAVDKYGLTKWHRKKFFEKHFEKSEQLKLM